MGRPYKIYRLLTYNLTLTKLCNYFTNILQERHRGYDVGLKPILGGSIPSFLSLLLHKRVLQMYDMEEDIREVTLGLL